MKDWDTDEKPSRWFWLEIAIAGALVGSSFLGFLFGIWNTVKGWLS